MRSEPDTRALPVPPPPLAPSREAVEHCRALTAAHSSTFYLGSRLFPPEERRAVWAVYAACRTGDDIVDEADAAGAAERLEAWRLEVCAALEGRPGHTPLAEALAWAAGRFPIRPGPFHELYLGLRMDLEMDRGERGYESLDDLLLYCRRVAGMVGWMIAPIGGFDGGAATLERALKLGMAMQLTNILRDVGEDLGRGRVYLPAEGLARHGLARTDLETGRVTPGYRALMEELAALARDLYREGWAGIPALRGPARLAVGVAAASYEGILGSLERNNWDNFSRRAYVSNRRKLALIPSTWWALRRPAGPL